MLYSTKSAAWQRFMSQKKINIPKLQTLCGEEYAYTIKFPVKSSDGMPGWSLKPKLPIETIKCFELCEEFLHELS